MPAAGRGVMNAFMRIHLLTGWLPICLFAITAIGFVAVLLMKPANGRRKGLRREFAAALAGAVGGFVLIWLLSDIWLVFGVSLGWLVITEITIAIALICLLITAIADSHRARRILAAVMIPLIIASCALQVDMVYGEYTTVGSLLNAPTYRHLDDKTVDDRNGTISVDEWRQLVKDGHAPAMPKQGEINQVTIPPTISGFAARMTDVYLPPAALSKRPPRLPVMIMLAGQPGSPDRFFDASQISGMLDAYASSHHGLAPIVVSPDQNGAATHNSLCADTPVYGNAETYLTVDVTNWVKKNLPVAATPNQWLIGGFSQGGTCSTQLGPAHPEIYGHIFAADGELEPTDHTRADTIERYFAGNEHAYERHVPTHIIARHAPSKQTLFSVAGSWDVASQRNQLAIGKAAVKAGMQVTAVTALNSGHDWHAVQAGLRPTLERFCKQTGLGTQVTPLSAYGDIKVVDLQPIPKVLGRTETERAAAHGTGAVRPITDRIEADHAETHGDPTHTADNQRGLR
jgi:enterochelin esterase-like enzyme